MFEMKKHFFQSNLPETSKPVPPVPECKPAKPTVYEILISTYKLASQGMKDNFNYTGDSYKEGMFDTYEQIARHLETQI